MQAHTHTDTQTDTHTHTHTAYPSGEGGAATFLQLGISGQIGPDDVRCVVLVPKLWAAF